MYSVCCENADALSSYSDAGSCVTIKLLDSVFNILQVFEHRWEIQTYTGDFPSVRMATPGVTYPCS
jgi:hypothetical protein